MELVQSSYTLYQYTTESLISAYDYLAVAPGVVSRYMRRKRRYWRRRGLLRSIVKQIGLGGLTRRSRRQNNRQQRQVRSNQQQQQQRVPNAIARAGRGFVLSPSKQQGRTSIGGNGASGAKLQSLQDELSKLRAEIDSIMMGDDDDDDNTTTTTNSTATSVAMNANNTDMTDDDNGERIANAMADDDAIPALADATAAVVVVAPMAPPPMPTKALSTRKPTTSMSDSDTRSSVGGSRPLSFKTTDPKPQNFARPSMPTANDAAAQRNRLVSFQSKENDDCQQQQQQQLTSGELPTAKDFANGRRRLKATKQRRSIGGTPWRTPPREREARMLDELADDDAHAAGDTQALIARALRKKFSSLRANRTPAVKRGGVVVVGQGRVALSQIAQ